MSSGLTCGLELERSDSSRREERKGKESLMISNPQGASSLHIITSMTLVDELS